MARDAIRMVSYDDAACVLRWFANVTRNCLLSIR